ncbi:hypothetical protein [Rhizobium rhizogenes]|uniref:hypothetical protein n=1 Tax=Rhizobium rhizogenes TaxID=359 RepID=UPI001573BF26|nr:hypothetical protein [Rhizobium rhizogenes]NTF65753.1 SAM-dependent methyltransferase [Rhizobium rhizogenes]NTG97105.1 SAM-dependent methyltransferase [Rhizobium rhizogenes]
MPTWLIHILGKDRNEPVTNIIDAYTFLLDSHRGSVMDVGTLPIPKAEMKSLLKSLYSGTSDPKLRLAAGLSFVLLAHFQEGVGPVPVDPISVAGNFTIKILNPAPQETEKLKRLVLQPDAEKTERFMFWQAAVATESNTLLGEWTSFLNSGPI